MSPTLDLVSTRRERPSHQKSLTALQHYFGLVSNRPHPKDVPHISEPLLSKTRNSKRNSPENNDLLEFVGDRCVNLVAALLVDRVRVSWTHHLAVRRVVCNNDTFGRLAFCLHFERNAKLDDEDALEVDAWNPQSSKRAPKALADLFEAYAGAVYVQHGWKRVMHWLSLVFEPIIKVATHDYWYHNLPNYMRGDRFFADNPITPRLQDKFLDFLDYKPDFLVEKCSPAIEALASDTRFVFSVKGELEEPHCEEIETAIQLLNFWICDMTLKIWPQYHHATARAPHLATCITDMIMSDLSLSYLARIISLPDCITTRSETRPTSIKKALSPNILATAFKALVGLHYRSKNDVAGVWATEWLRPLVIRAHDIIIELPGSRPRLSSSATSKVVGADDLVDSIGRLSLGSTQSTSSPEPDDDDEDVIEALAGQLKGIGIGTEHEKKASPEPPSSPRPRVKSRSSTDSNTPPCINIKLNTRLDGPLLPQNNPTESLDPIASPVASATKDRSSHASSSRSSTTSCVSAPGINSTVVRSNNREDIISKRTRDSTSNTMSSDEAPHGRPIMSKHTKWKSVSHHPPATASSSAFVSSPSMPDSGYSSSATGPDSINTSRESSSSSSSFSPSPSPSNSSSVEPKFSAQDNKNEAEETYVPHPNHPRVKWQAWQSKTQRGQAGTGGKTKTKTRAGIPTLA